jgi:hypothetical protein
VVQIVADKQKHLVAIVKSKLPVQWTLHVASSRARQYRTTNVIVLVILQKALGTSSTTLAYETCRSRRRSAFPTLGRCVPHSHLLANATLIYIATPQVPAIIYLERVDMDEQLDLSQLQSRIDDRILGRDTNIAMSVSGLVFCCGGSGSLIFHADIVTRRSSSMSCSKRMRCRGRTPWSLSTRSSCSCSRCVAL